MRYPAAEKVEIIRLVEASHLPARRTLEKLGIPRATFYRWYDRYRDSGPEALGDRRSRPDRVWNRIPEAIRDEIIDLALALPELSPRELAVRFTDEKKYFVSEASVYRLLKAHDLITSPAYIVIKAAEAFNDKTTAPNQLWQTDFTYLKIVGWGWYYLSTVLDDFSRFIVAWKLCATMRAEDVTATLDLALAAAGLDQSDDLDLLGCGVSHTSSPPSPVMLFFSRRFSRVRSATTSFSAWASRRRSLTSSDVAARAVSPASLFLPASRNSLDHP